MSLTTRGAPVLDVRDVTKTYGQGESVVHALRGVDLRRAPLGHAAAPGDQVDEAAEEREEDDEDDPQRLGPAADGPVGEEVADDDPQDVEPGEQEEELEDEQDEVPQLHGGLLEVVTGTLARIR